MNVVQYVRLQSRHSGYTADMWHVERDGRSYLMVFERSSGISWDVLAKGSKGSITREFNREVRNRLEGVEEFGEDVKVISKRPDADAEKRFQVFIKPVFGRETDWEDTEEVSEDTEEDRVEQEFHKLLKSQLNSWKGWSTGAFRVLKHEYWPVLVCLGHKTGIEDVLAGNLYDPGSFQTHQFCRAGQR